MKGCSLFLSMLIVAAILVGIYTVHAYMDAMTPVWSVTAAQQAQIDLQANMENTRTDVQAHAERSQLITGALSGFGTVLLIILVGAGGVFIWSKYDQRKESWARAVDGTFALQQFSNGNVKWMVDPNKSLTGAVGFNKPSGLLGEFASQAMGPERQLAYAVAVQKTRTTSAASTDNGVKYAAHAKLLAGAYDKPYRSDIPQLLAQDDGDSVATWQPLTVQDAFAQSDSSRWVMGQSPLTGELFELNPKEAAHFGIVGATGTGKTAYTALLLMAYAMRNRYRVVILDGKGGADWSKYQSLVEYTSLDYANVGGIVGQMSSEYEKRQAILNQYGVNSIWELPKGGGIPRPTLFIVDEFGAVMDSLKAASKTAYKAVELDLGNLLRLSRGAGLYIVLCDQNPSKWPGTVRANLPVNLCYRLGGGIGNAVQEYNLDKLDRVGQFQVSNTVYNAFPTYQVIDELLPDASYRKPLALLTADSSITGYRKEGGDLSQEPTPKSITVEPVTAPVLTGKPVTVTEKSRVLNIYAVTGSKSETCRLVWGGKNGQRMAWLNEILQGGEVQQ